ncbi:MAG: DUF262 domain-containing protein [Bacteroidetes bacterium]|jgi:uncharacterized protein with ParB-like and HNH nuclease domain|nr:DUF262 domain-containing protein [Bacteroidota bacterium]
MKVDNLQYRSKPITVDQIIEEEIFFKIPIYQRLYVWEKEQIHALLSDITSSFQQHKNGESPVFFLGNVIVQEDKRDDKTVYELIDGQQRFTTLWLLSIYLQRELKSYAFPDNGGQENSQKIPLRIEFDIREQVTEFMREIINHYNDNGDSKELDLDIMVQKNPEKGFDTGTLEPLADAFKEIKTFFNNHLDEGFDKEEFSRYVSTQVKLVKTIVPKSADLNKLFEVLNNRGVQLEHHQILKARMLEICNKGTDTLEYGTEDYAILWDSCSGMNEFIEKGFQDASGKRLTELYTYEKETTGYSIYKDAKRVLSDLRFLDKDQSEKNDFSDGGMSLRDILNEDQTDPKQRDKKKEGVYDERSQEVKSIVNFPMLLQHTLRIFRKKNGKSDIDRILDKELIKSFDVYFFYDLRELSDEEQARQVADYIELLWEVRFAFDEYVVKWIKDEGTDILNLCRLYEKKDDNNVYLYRQTKEYLPELTQLQRLLYHSQEMRTFYWLTPFLHFLTQYDEDVEDDRGLALLYLRYLDNHLLNINLEDDMPLIERTSWFMDEIIEDRIASRNRFQPNTSIMKKPLGLGFPHYWFYKLEYLLWLKIREKDFQSGKDIKRHVEQLRTFKITAKNSVEHIAPQNPIDRSQKSEVANDKELLNCFGNLALVSRSLNSSLSNSSYKLKREKFNESNKMRGRIESLKLLLVYESEQENWKREDIQSHQNAMIQYFKGYLETCKKEYEELRNL